MKKKTQVGFATDISFTRSYISKLDTPYSTCRKDVSAYSDSDSKYYKFALQFDDHYSNLLCTEFCVQFEHIQPNCNCTDPSVPVLNRNHTVCTSERDLKCVGGVRNRFNKESTNCDAYCPTECDQFKFSTTLSMASCMCFLRNI
jgi:hypothetical protein